MTEDPGPGDLTVEQLRERASTRRQQTQEQGEAEPAVLHGNRGDKPADQRLGWRLAARWHKLRLWWEPYRRRAEIAWASVLGVVVVVLLVALVWHPWDRPVKDARVGTTAGLSAFKVGDCPDDPAVRDDPSVVIDPSVYTKSVEQIDHLTYGDCKASDGHDAQILAIKTVEQGQPPALKTGKEQRAVCEPPQSYSMKYIVPSAQLWATGFHKVLCLGVAGDGELMGPIPT